MLRKLETIYVRVCFWPFKDTNDLKQHYPLCSKFIARNPQKLVKNLVRGSLPLEMVRVPI